MQATDVLALKLKISRVIIYSYIFTDSILIIPSETAFKESLEKSRPIETKWFQKLTINVQTKLYRMNLIEIFSVAE